MAVRVLKTLSLKRKIELITEFEQQRKAQKTIAHEYGIPPNTVSTILKQREYYKQLYFYGQVDVSRRRQRTAQHDDIEELLLNWYSETKLTDDSINGISLKNKANAIAAELGKKWKCSEGWLMRFKKRHCIVLKNDTGRRKKANAEHKEEDDWKSTILGDVLKVFQARDIFHADETAFHWRALPEKLVPSEVRERICPDVKQAKERVTILFCVNMDGSEKWPLFVVGRFAKPHCFQGIQRLPTMYAANKESRLTPDLFEPWLVEFDKEMTARGRRVTLVIDSNTAHSKVSDLQSTQLVFLPPKMTSRFLPCSQGIVYNLKHHYKTQLLRRLAKTGTGADVSTFKHTLLDACCMLRTAWRKIEPATISNCFYKTGFHKSLLAVRLERADREQENGDEVAEYDSQEQEVVDSEVVEPLLSRLYNENGLTDSHDGFVDIDLELSCSSAPAEENDVSPGQSGSADSDEDDLGPSLPVVTDRQVYQSLSTISTYLMQKGSPADITDALTKLEVLLETHLGKNTV